MISKILTTQPIPVGNRKAEITRLSLLCHVFLSVVLVFGIWLTGGLITAEIVGWVLGVPFGLSGALAAANAAEHKAKNNSPMDKTNG